MEKHVHSIFNEDILSEAARRYEMDPDSLFKVGGFENYVYRYTFRGKEYILRLTHSSHRSGGQVQAELDFVAFLAANDAAVSMPVRSKENYLVEKIEIEPDNYFLVTAFTKAPGRHVKKEDLTESLFREWGKSIGKIHRLTKSYVPNTVARRPSWHDDKVFSNAREYIPVGNELVVQKLEQLVQNLKVLPHDRDSYGLIHTDIHTGNFFIDDDRITIFDFDDSAYQYFISDIAIALFYSLMSLDALEERIAFADSFLTHFLAGYREENQLSDYWIQQIPNFLKLREMELYVVVYRSLDMDNPGPWEKRYMQNRKELIENDTPYIGTEFDFSPYLSR